MADNITKGKFNQIKGKAKEESGKLTGNKSQKIRDKAENAAGKVQEQYGGEERQVHDVSNSPGYQAFHEVYITKSFGPERNEDLVAFINKHITEFKGKTEDKHGIPQMLFERAQDAQEFANELRSKLNIPKEHITVKARKYTR